MFDAPAHRGPPSDHFDGRRFRNVMRARHGTVGDFLRWQATREPGRWRRVDAAPGPPPPRSVDRGVRVTLINHATTLVQLDGLNVLTDPVWAERVSPVSFAGPRRYRPPGLRFEDLPPIDLVLISHNHYDHLCVPTLRRLARTHRPRIVTGLGNRALLEREGIGRATEIDWWESTPIRDDVTVTGTPARHFSGRGTHDRDVTLWMGLSITAPSGHVFFAGDTGYGEHFHQVRLRLGPPRLSLLPIGAFRPEWFMRQVHVSPAEAVQAHLDLESGTSVGIHYGTFRLADDGQDEPLVELAAARERTGVSAERFRALEHGVGHVVAEGQAGRVAAE